MMHPTAAPAAAAPHCTRTAHHETVAFLRFLYRDSRGFIAVNAGIADATASTGIRMLFPTKDNPNEQDTRKWFYYDALRPDLIDAAADYVQHLAAQYGNVYVLRALAKRRGGLGEADMVPSPIVFCDDAPAAAPIPWTCYVASGTGPGQAYYVCDKPATKDDAKRVAAALGCDPSGVSLCKLVRVPGTFNTKPKHGGRFLVRVQAQRRGVVSLATLRDTYPALAHRSAPGGAHEAATPPAGALFNADRISTYRARFATRTALLRTVNSTVDHVTRIPDRVKPGTLTYQLLTDAALRYAWTNPSGSWDASRVRYHICLGLVERGYDCDFIVAYLDYCEEPATRDLKGEHNLRGDYARLFNADKLGTRYAQKQEAQRAYRARSDRPQQYTVGSYYAWLQTQQQDGTVPHKRRERAALAGISTATLDRLEDALEDTGRIRIDTASDRSGSIVTLLGGVINILVTAPEPSPADTPSTPTEVLSGLCTEHAVCGFTTGQTAIPPVMHKNTSSLLPVLPVLADAQTAAETPCNERSAADAADAADAAAERDVFLSTSARRDRTSASRAA